MCGVGELIFITGGARSGKSRFAERLAGNFGRVVYLATLEPGDAEMQRRVEVHRASRPAAWPTIEEPLAVTGALEGAAPYDVCLLDCVTLWLSNLLLSPLAQGSSDADAAAHVLGRVQALLAWQERRSESLILVSNEVGSGLVPEYPLGRLYRDILGEANQVLSAAADEAYVCVAGYALDLKALGRRV